MYCSDGHLVGAQYTEAGNTSQRTRGLPHSLGTHPWQPATIICAGPFWGLLALVRIVIVLYLSSFSLWAPLKATITYHLLLEALLGAWQARSIIPSITLLAG